MTPGKPIQHALDEGFALRGGGGHGVSAALASVSVPVASATPSLVMMFTGQGSQYPGMGRGLYEHEPVFQAQLDECAQQLRRYAGADLREVMFSGGPQAKLDDTLWAQPSLFALEYSLAKLLESRGLRAQAMIGHSLGEYVAACLAGVFSLEQGLQLVWSRARLMQSAAPGRMLAVSMGEEQMQSLLTRSGCSLAAVNAPGSCVASGSAQSIASLQKMLAERKVRCSLLRTSHAFHSTMMDEVLEPFRQVLGVVRFQAPQRSYLSNVTGRYVTAQEATSIDYWVKHLRSTVRFSQGIAALLSEGQRRIYLEVGPGMALTVLARRQQSESGDLMVSSMRAAQSEERDEEVFRGALEQMRVGGARFVDAAKPVGVPQPIGVAQPVELPQPVPRVTPAELIQHAMDEGVLLRTEGGRLIFEATRGPLSQELRTRLRDSKQAVIDHLEHLQKRSSLARGEADTPQVKRRGAGAGEHLPLSYAQKRMWFVHNLDPGSGQYNMLGAYRLSGELDKGALVSALHEIARRHETLRTRFRETDTDIVQVVQAESALPMLEHDLRNSEPQARERAVAEILREEARKPFDLSQDVLLRVHLVAIGVAEHVIVFNMHHIISDHFSVNVLIGELSVLYSAYSRGLPSPLAPLAVQYSDYSDWQRTWLQTDAARNQVEYWKRTMDGAPSIHNLPLRAPRPARRTTNGGLHVQQFSKDEVRAYKLLCKRHGGTLYMFLQTALALLIGRFSGQRDIVVGTPFSGRHHAEVQPLIGLFINVLPIRTKIDPGSTFRELLTASIESMRQVFAHQEVPLDLLVEELNPARSLSHLPIVQILFNYVTHGGTRPNLDGVKLQPLYTSTVTSRFDLELDVGGFEDQLVIGWIYNTDLFSAELMRELADCFRTLLANAVANPDQCVERIPLLTDEKVSRQLSLGRGPEVSAAEHPSPALIHELFEEQVRRDPQGVAVVYGQQELSYWELNERANRLAHYLRGRGVQPDARVGLCVERGLGMVVGLLGILKSGAAYVPLDPAYPRDRLQYMLEDAAPQVVLTQERLKELLPAGQPGQAELVTLDGDWERIEAGARESAQNLPAASIGVRPEHLAYVIYTSGSTGRPKGVMVTHAGVVNFLHSMQRSPGIESSDRLLAVTTLSFDIAGLEIYLPLISGAQVVVLDRETAVDAQRLIQSIEQYRPTILQATPSTWRMLLSAGWSGSASLKVLCGGEALTSELAGQLLPRVGQLWNVYGPTETTIWSCLRQVRSVGAQAVESIGKPIENTQVYLLDEARQPVPIGVVGEIYIGGAGVARGYRNREELTSERFLSDPFGSGPQARMYRTGDLGRWSADGNIEYFGRGDHQVKVRGFRIEPGEIEAQLVKCAGVREALVMAWGEAGEQRLVAYIAGELAGDTGAVGAAATVDTLRAQLRAVLPEYMVPSAFVPLEALPRTPNGKVDRQRLPAPEAGITSSREYEPPQGELEERLSRIWQELLQVPRVGRQDSFFELGGHSLLAVRLAARIRETLERQISLRELFEHPTLRGLSEHLGGAAASETAPIERADRNRPLPLSWSQQRLWFIDQLEGAGAAYHIRSAVRLHGELNREALRKALDSLIERHESLRTVFANQEGDAVQLIREPTGFALRIEDLRGLEAARREDEVKRQAAEEAHAVFDLRSGPLIRGRLLRMSDEEHVLLVTMHHIVSDGWSMSVLIREVAQLYEAYRQDLPNPLAPLPIQYADYAVWQRGSVQAQALPGQVDYWKQQLSGAPALLELPADRARPAVQSYRGGSVSFALDGKLSAGLRELSRRHDTTLLMTLYAGFSVLLSRLTGQKDLVIGVPVANRQRTEVEGLIGLFVNTLAVRTHLQDPMSVRELLAQVKQLTLDAYSRQDVPFEQVVEAVQPPRSLSHSPVFQVMLVLQNTPHSEVRLPGLRLAPQATSSGTSQFDLTLSLQEVGGELVGRFEYASDLFDAATIQRWVGHLKCLLRGMVEEPGSRLSALDILGQPVRQQILERFNETSVEHPSPALIHELFEEQVCRDPQGVAVVYGQQELSYWELNERANRLAHYLRGRGVQPDARVGLCVERGLGMVVGLLGILKSGAAYVPLDPAYPRDRLQYMLEDAAPQVVLTQERLKELLPAGQPGQAELVTLDGDWERIEAGARESAQNLPAASIGVRPEHLAYVIYTSGSTGRPKGVMVTHAGVVNFLHSMQRSPGIESSDRLLAVTTLSFDIAGLEIYLPLISGAQVVVLDRETAVDAQRLIQSIEQYRPTILQATPSTWRMLLSAGWSGSASLKVLCGGEALTSELAGQLLPRVGQLWNVYGPTETTIWSCLRQLRSVGAQAVESIGKPIENTQVYLLDEARQPVPVGVVGHIYIAGSGLARGYLNRPELTAERFIEIPFASGRDASPGSRERMYATGDLGRWQPDGNIEYLGRNDHQVKIRGSRIEVGEVQHTVESLPCVRECLVDAAADEAGERRLIAYIVPENGEPESAESYTAVTDQIVAGLRARLPDYMLPSAYVYLQSMPLTPNGKVDRAQLSSHRIDGQSRAYLAPRSEIEARLCAMWKDFLKVERVGVRDDFFLLGGHSLLVARLVSAMRSEFAADDGDVSIAAFFAARTVEKIAEYLEAKALAKKLSGRKREFASAGASVEEGTL